MFHSIYAVMDVWTKRWTSGTSPDTIKAQEEARESAYRNKRKEIEEKKKAKREAEEKRLPSLIAKNPAQLGAKTPTEWKTELEKAGENVMPLAKGHFKGVAFEAGGGWKVNFGGNRILSYHPAEHSHHKGAYYKISTSEGGTRRYELDGTENKS